MSDHAYGGSPGSNTGMSPEAQSQKDRTVLLRDMMSLAAEAALDEPTSSTEHMDGLMRELVREKLLSAEDSYRLRDQLTERGRLTKIIDHRIDQALHRRGLRIQSNLN